MIKLTRTFIGIPKINTLICGTVRDINPKTTSAIKEVIIKGNAKLIDSSKIIPNNLIMPSTPKVPKFVLSKGKYVKDWTNALMTAWCKSVKKNTHMDIQ
ncbi:Uncharacterised protein [Mycobacteroides abscessus subsp. abscessus]|nr:Uncharacterised protein [Mycobacteroides abscessus subsp. abscessus]